MLIRNEPPLLGGAPLEERARDVPKSSRADDSKALPMSENASLAYRPDIDGLRAVAVLSVVGYHAAPGTMPGGFAGVDVFFVISGFLISSIIFKGLEQGTFTLTDFYARRIRRIFPALLLVLTACLTFGWFALMPDEYAQLGKHTAAGAAFVSNFVLWLEAGYFDFAAELKPLRHLWSLGIEEQFYIVWPLLVLVLWRRTRTFFAVITLLAASSLALNIAFATSKPDATFHLPTSRFWELLLGCLLAYITLFKRGVTVGASSRFPSIVHSARFQQSLREAFPVLGVLFIAAAIFLNADKAFSGWWAFLPTLGAALLIAGGPSAWVSRKALGHPALVFVGLISYPLYLWHWPILSYLRILTTDQMSVNALRVTKVFAVALSVALAWCTYTLLECRIRYSKTRGVVGGLGFCAGLAFSLGAIVFLAQGFLSRTELRSDPFVVSETTRRSLSCEKVFGLNPGSNDYCVISTNAAPDSPLDLLIGDSQANGLFPALERAASRYGRRAAQLGGAGCFPAQGVQSFGNQAGDKNKCIKSISSSLQIALHDPRVQRVFIAAQWAYYFSGEPFGDAASYRSYIQIRGTGENKAVFQNGLNATLDQFRDTGKEIYFVHQIPELGFNPKECLRLRPINFLRPLRRPCTVSTVNVIKRQADYRKVVQQLLLARPFVRSIDPVIMLCDDRVCEVIRNGVFLYRNNDHLSVPGGLLLEPLFSPGPPQKTRPFRDWGTS